ncbi:hypothetical protein CDD81_563 [Ophiocordyceps australis]|uniref:RCC1-like domain-containing protein n=1 Tax=Ophiocordyceps australis TaxID=1399860 RepID=A0A2C5XKY9_9HYPO|nr:hypothetical protein CDD81_563 [Ophiocordyceps australis]
MAARASPGRARVRGPRQREAPVINHAPGKRLKIYVFGTNENGELGLGPITGPQDVRRPRMNPILSSPSAGVVQVAVGGMHCVALTHDNRLLTWGVNDMGALGRDTRYDAQDYHDVLVNPREATPDEVDMTLVPRDTVFTQVTASDNATFALTNKGYVYGWGTMRSNEGVAGFLPDVMIQPRPMLVPSVRQVTKILAGNNHVVALTIKGTVYTWGCGEQGQLGRRILTRLKAQCLVPFELRLRDIANIGVGANHSFAISHTGDVYGWGSNNFGQTGIASNNTGKDFGRVSLCTLATNISDIASIRNVGPIVDITGGNKHSLALTANGACFVWGQLDACATGISLRDLPRTGVIFDNRGHPRILTTPTMIPGLLARFVAAGGDHNVAITPDYRVFSWGFNDNHQTGNQREGDIETPTLINSSLIRNRPIVWAGLGGNFSLLGEVVEP